VNNMSELSDCIDDREREIAYLRRMLVGPAVGDAEVLNGTPFDRYLLGVLYPQGETDIAVAVSEEDGTEAPSEEEADNPISLAFERLPASMGISFLVAGAGDLELRLHAARYLKGASRHEWARKALSTEAAPLVLNMARPTGSGVRFQAHQDVWCDAARCHVVWRRHAQGWLVTVTLINKAESDSPRPSPADCLFQAAVEAVVPTADLLPYPESVAALGDDEDWEFALFYRDRRRLAVGHGCAAEWRQVDRGTVIRASVMPAHEVHAMTTVLRHDALLGAFDEKVLQLHHLADETVSAENLAGQLTGFVDRYASWISRQIADSHTLPSELLEAGSRIVSRLQSACDRMRRGIDCLMADPQVQRAFHLANRAMLMQMLHSAKDVGGTPHPLGRPAASVDYDGVAGKRAEWRPFQLGFHLLVMESLVNEDSDDRQIVDLIWFPTGGGKTEAYLWAAAFEVFLRRLRFGPAGGGTAVIKRYTLRLLTSQQFQRAAALICASELLRRAHPELGDDPIRVGLWVGGEVTPNRFQKAAQLYEEMLQMEQPENPFQLQHCPWCGTLIIPPERDERATSYGVRATDTSFLFFCPEHTCQFHDRLPVAVVDEDLFAAPPALIIGTIDKFARLAWDSRSGVFFGSEGRKPPSLIIQDELHLISGPLGTIAALYEAGIDTVLQLRGGRPKVIAATATIRRASDQAERLYGRRVAVFPPSGLSARDSYFAAEDSSSPGRAYLGVMATGHTPVTALVRTAAAMIQAAEEAGLETDSAKDAYWSVLVYHNSRRELGKTMTLARDDVPAWVKSVTAADQSRARPVLNVEEVSANVSGPRLPDVLRRLAQPWTSRDCPDIAPCTNMISVGVDIQRLGAMLVVGQPKTTSEYIQATSRVGRSKVPGLVVTLYSPTKPRDRSHYEDFVGYHTALYRNVEPTSVTPLALPARTRALHAALVIAERHGGGLSENDSATEFDPAVEPFSLVLETLRKRLQLVEPAEAHHAQAHLSALVEVWAQRAAEARATGAKLLFDGTDFPQFAALLCNFENRMPDRWPTLNSMRHVDKECVVHVFGTPLGN